MRAWRALGGLFALVLCALLGSCGGGSGDGDANPYPACGPINTDAGRPNTLERVIRADTTLKKSCSPYAIDGPVQVQATLTIEPGVVIKACQGGCRSRITVTRNGKLLAAGSAAEPILLSSVYADSANPSGPPGGQWTGILFLESQPGSRLEHVIIEHAGGRWSVLQDSDEFERYEFPVEASLQNDSTPDLTVQDVWIRKGNGYAMAGTTSDAFDATLGVLFAAFDRVTMTEDAKGIWLAVDQGGALGADLCFAARDMAGACPAGVAAPAGNYVELHLDDKLGRTIEDVTRDAAWKPYAVPYKVDNVNVTHGALLTVADGVELRMTDLGGITVRLNSAGAISMVAAAPGGIKVTSFLRTPQHEPTTAEHWRGLYLWDRADGARTRIENVDLGYGGRRAPIITEAPAIIGVYGSSPTIVGNHVHHSAGTGIHWNCASAPAGLEAPPANTNTSDPATIACAPMVGMGGIAENYGCDCGMMTNCQTNCPQP